MAANDRFYEQRRQLENTVKKTLLLQEKAGVPNQIDSKSLDNLRMILDKLWSMDSDTLQKSVEYTKNTLSRITLQQQPKTCANNVENVSSNNNAVGQHLPIFKESRSLSGAASIDNLRKSTLPDISSPVEEEEDLYENTGPASRFATLNLLDSGKIPYAYM